MRMTKKDIEYFFPQYIRQAGHALYWGGCVMRYREDPDPYETQVSAQVEKDGIDYDVNIVYTSKGSLSGYCPCSGFRISGTCAHLAALCYAFSESTGIHADRPSTDSPAAKMLSAYRRRTDSLPTLSGPKAKLVPEINLLPGSYPSFNFKVGRERLYVVKNLSEFMRYFQHETEHVYGKQLTLTHSLNEFDEHSQQLLLALRNEFPTDWDPMSSKGSLYSPYYSYRYSSSPGSVTFTGDAFDRWFDLLKGMTIQQYYSADTCTFAEEDPSVRLRFRSENGMVYMTLNDDTPVQWFGSPRQTYVVTGNQIYRCSPEFTRRVLPLLQGNPGTIRMTTADFTDFCSCVLPEVQEFAELDDPEDLLSRYLPHECTPRYYFDLPDDGLSARVTWMYGDKERAPHDSKKKFSGIRRDTRTEDRSLQALTRCGFEETDQKGTMLLTGDDEIYSFLTERLNDFYEIGDVYVSDRLQKKQIQPAPSAVGVSVSSGLITLDFDTGEFPTEELEALYQSLLQKRRYHRLKDGRFLTLNGSSYETLAELAHMTQLSQKELEAGQAVMPAYRAPWLDSVLSGSENMEVTRDQTFKNMIRSFKTVSDSDYAVPNSLKKVLRPYQKTGYRWLKTLESSHFGGILADEMGLGKTLQIITWLSSVYPGEEKPSLIVCPASLILNWADEFKKFAPELPVTLIYGTAQERREQLAGIQPGTILVTSYDLLKRDRDTYSSLSFYACVLDEGQFIKNQTTLVSKAVKQINCVQRFVLTGTPIENRLSELWNLFDFLMPGYLFNHTRFVEKLEKPIVKSEDAEARAQLAKLVQPFLLRRLKQDVLKELPPKIEHIRRITLTEEERKVYAASAAAAVGELQGSGKLAILAALTRLRQICCDPNLCFENYDGPASKLDACIDLCASMSENGHQILLFSQFTSMLDILRARLADAGISTYTLQGSTPREERARLVRRFNEGGASVFLISLKAGGTGLNLTAADVVIHYDPWWNLAAQTQATDRAHRIGQKAKVQVYKLIAADTIEEKIIDLQNQKAGLMDIVGEDADSAILSMSSADLLKLLE